LIEKKRINEQTNVSINELYRLTQCFIELNHDN